MRRPRTINWTPQRLQLLKEGIEVAKREHAPAFAIDLDKYTKDVQFDLGYAEHLAAHLDRQFTLHPPRQYPENREGEEPGSYDLARVRS